MISRLFIMFIICVSSRDSDTDADDFIGKFKVPISKIIEAKKVMYDHFLRCPLPIDTFKLTLNHANS